MTRPATSKRRGRPPAGEQRGERPRAEQILESALVDFATTGFQGASLRKIAARAGVDVALITHHFGSKDDLWRAAINAVSERLINAINALPDPSSPQPRPMNEGEQLARVMTQLVDIACDTPHLAQFVMNEIARQDDSFSDIYEKLIRPIRDILLPLITAAREAGVIGKVDADFFFLSFAGSIVTTVASRSFMGQLSRTALDDAAFRMELKRAVLGKLDIDQS